ncbi:hypothetical protein [Hymenobacter psoromatis]|uniref:hypothetical protein n=1 Tax=Hymenobacter psoromatis TaxID=1484116 RepID=UPI001CBB28DD|nr:hypothetical protein [Hymenobacter psoromatis]
MEPTHGNTPSGSHGTASSGDILPAPLASTAPVSGPVGASARSYSPPKDSPAGQTVLQDTLASSKKWLDESGLTEKAQQLPQTAKDLGTKAWTSVNDLSTTQKLVGVGLLTAGVAFLATISRRADQGEYRHVPRRSPFAKKPHGKGSEEHGPRAQQRPWGSSRYGSSAAPAGGERVKAGSGYAAGPSHGADKGSSRPTASRSGQRRDQGPAAGSRYDAKKSGGQNPNNLDF